MLLTNNRLFSGVSRCLHGFRVSSHELWMLCCREGQAQFSCLKIERLDNVERLVLVAGYWCDRILLWCLCSRNVASPTRFDWTWVGALVGGIYPRLKQQELLASRQHHNKVSQSKASKASITIITRRGYRHYISIRGIILSSITPSSTPWPTSLYNPQPRLPSNWIFLHA